MTARRTVATGLAGVLLLLAAAALGNLLGGGAELASGAEWVGHTTVHVVFGALTLALAGWIGRVRRATPASGWAERGLDAMRLVAFVVSATAVVEGIGAYPPLEVLHNVVYANVAALLVLLLGLLFVAAVGVWRLLRDRNR